MECGACERNCPANAVSVTAGVGCAAGIIMSATGSGSGCDCSVEPSCG
jgi:ferredoxin